MNGLNDCVPAMARWVAVGLIIFCGHATAIDTDLLAGLQARNIGPAAVGGRIAAIDVVSANPNHIVVGVATGGVWISINGGLNWKPVFDEQAVASIGAVAIFQPNPDIIWVGTGEGNVRNSTSIGDGLYKSVDGGETWALVGLQGTERINRIAVHPDNPDIVYVAAMGTLWGENTDRGVYRTVDGGQSWQKILYVDERTGATDIKINPANPNRLYAGMWEFRRWPYFFKSGGPGSGMYVSLDGGDTWEQKTEEDGLPAGELGRMVFAPSPARPSRVYALVEAEKSALLRSEDWGASWAKVNEGYNIHDRPFYYTELAADPVNPDRVYNISTRLRVSIDGGANFEYVAAIDCCAASNTVHIDNHALWINPHDPHHLIIGNDGGLAISRDQTQTWRFVRNMPLAQFYHVAVDNDNPYNVYGGLQDNGSWRGPAEVWENAGIRNVHWQEVGFGDGFDTVPDPENSRSGYAMSQGGFLTRWNLDSGESRFIRPPQPSQDVSLRFNWSAGFAQDPFATGTIYYGSQFVHRSTDRGENWEIISADLTSNNPDFQTYHQSGGLTSDVTAAENYTSIVSIAPSAVEQGVIWVGTDDGRVHVTTDGGASWNRIDRQGRGVPEGAWIPMIYPSAFDAGTAFVVVDDHRRSDHAPYVYRVENFGARWRSLVTDELQGYALSIVQDHVDPKLLFLGTELGLFFSTNGGDNWDKFDAGVPTVSVMDLAIQARESDLVLGTHGRSIYVIDDYAALRSLETSHFDQRLAILSVTPGQQYDPGQTPSSRFTGSGEYRAANEPYGALVTFMASGDDLPHPDAEKEKQRKRNKRAGAAPDADGENDEESAAKPPRVTVEVRDLEGKLLRTFKQPLKQGVNRLVWNMRVDGVRRMPSPDADSGDDGLPAGPQVTPGTYTITLKYEDQTATREVEVLDDPRTDYSLADRQANLDALLAIQGLREQAVSEVERIVHARDDIKIITKLIAQKPDAAKDESLKTLKKQAAELTEALNKLEQQFRVPPRAKGIQFDDDKIVNQIGLAATYAGSTLGRPSPAAAQYAAQAKAQLMDAQAAVNAFMQSELSEFRMAVERAGIGLLSAATASGSQ